MARASGWAAVAGVLAWSATATAQACSATVQPDVAWGARPSDNSHPNAAFKIMNHLDCRSCQPEVSMLLTAGPASPNMPLGNRAGILGEGFGAYRIGHDAELFPLISSANVACGFHGGDPRVMERTVRVAAEQGVAIGAHPSYPDLVGFGRRLMAASPAEVRSDLLYQLGALDAFCRAVGLRMRHVKAHGALYNHATTAPTTAAAIAGAVAAFDPDLILFAMPGSALLAAGEAAGLTVAREGFADRAYSADGTLVSRREPGALITDPEEAAARMLRLVREGRLRAIDGNEIDLEIDTICTHSDTPGAVEIARTVRRRLEDAGIAIRAPGVT